MSRPRNPFEVSSAPDIPPFGREGVIREIFYSLGGKPTQGPECFSLVGPPYIGKTTVLQSLASREVQREYFGDPEGIRLVYFHCADLPSERQEVFRLLGKAAIRAAEQEWSIAFKGNLVAEHISQLETSSAISEITTAFEGLLKALSSRHNRSIVFVLDEFERLLALFTESDIQFMRDVFSNTKHALVVATPKPIRDHSRRPSSSKFYEIFKKYHLRAFSLDQAYNYLSETTRDSKRQFSHSEKEVILKKAGPHPHILRAYAAEAWRRKLNQPAGRPLEDFDRVDRKVRIALNETFLSLWESLEPNLQAALYQFTTGQVAEERIIRTLQCLEDEHGLVYRTSGGHFEIMGELLKDFVVSQTELIDFLLRTDFYRAGLRALDQFHEVKYLDTDPQFYYQKAFQQFTAPAPDYDSANAMIRDAFERLLDVMVKRSEPHLGRTFTGAGYKDKMSFIEEAFEIEDCISRLFSDFWNVANESGPHPGKPANQYNTQLRLYILSGAIQYLLNARPKTGHP
jgi:hypothetical protein